MQLYFIRHGQSVNNAAWERLGNNSERNQDPELTETGRLQAKKLALFLKQAGDGFAPDGRDTQNTSGFGLTHLYTSLMQRAVATGEILADILGLPLVAWVDLHEGGGVFLDDEAIGIQIGQPGTPRSFFETHYPKLLLPDTLDEIGWWNKPFESREERRIRARRMLTELSQRHGNTNDRVAIVSHGGFYNHLMAVLLKPNEVERQPAPASLQALAGDNTILTEERDVWFTMNNAAITRIDFAADEIKVCYQNRADFLPRELIT